MLDPESVRVLVAERARFHRFISLRVGSVTEADDLLQASLLRALQRGDSLRRGERVVAWFYRILRNAIADHYRDKKLQRQHAEPMEAEMRSTRGSRMDPPPDWETAVCACFRGLLPALKPRYAQVLLRLDLRGEDKESVARDLQMSRGTLDVVLYRARQSLRERLEILCGACSRESCLTCACEARERRSARKV